MIRKVADSRYHNSHPYKNNRDQINTLAGQQNCRMNKRLNCCILNSCIDKTDIELFHCRSSLAGKYSCCLREIEKWTRGRMCSQCLSLNRINSCRHRIDIDYLLHYRRNSQMDRSKNLLYSLYGLYSNSDSFRSCCKLRKYSCKLYKSGECHFNRDNQSDKHISLYYQGHEDYHLSK